MMTEAVNGFENGYPRNVNQGSGRIEVFITGCVELFDF